MVAPLVGTPVTPNHLTTLRLACGAAAALAYAHGDPGWWAVGGVLFVVAMLLDRADGMLARLSSRTSRFGHRYDLVSDALCNALVFLGLGFGSRHGSLGWSAVLLGVVAGVAVVAVLGLVLRAEKQRGSRAGELPGLAGFDPDDAMIVVPIAAWLGYAQTLLWLAATVTPAVALLFAWWLGRRQSEK